MVLTDSGLLGFWLRFRSVTGFFKPAPSRNPRHKPKILAAHHYIFSVNALKFQYQTGSNAPMHFLACSGINGKHIAKSETWLHLANRF